MNESLKALCILALMVAVPVAAIAWTDSRPSDTTWIVRWVASIGGVAAIAFFLMLHKKRRDLAPDYLREKIGEYFNCGGFCFTVGNPAVDPFGNFVLWFQNQYARPCRAHVILKPTRGFWMNKSHLGQMHIHVECEGGELGMVTAPIIADNEFPGGKTTIDVSAEIEYPNGRGKRLRFHEGMSVRGMSNWISGLAPLAGIFVFRRPARISINFPPLCTTGEPDDRVAVKSTYATYNELPTES